MATLHEKNLAYVDNAVVCAQKRQTKLWKSVQTKRQSGGILPLTDLLLNEYIESARMTASLMTDIEQVRDEYLAEKAGKPAQKRAGKAKIKGRTPRRSRR